MFNLEKVDNNVLIGDETNVRIRKIIAKLGVQKKLKKEEVIKCTAFMESK